MKNKRLLLVLALIGLLSLPQDSSANALSRDTEAAPAASAEENVATAADDSSPACIIEGTVRTVRQNTASPDYYDVSIELSGISAVSGEGAGNCDGKYASQIEKAGQILRASDYLKKAIKEEDGVKAKITFGSDGNMTGFFLSDIQITDEAATLADKKIDTTKTAKKDDDSTKMLFGALGLVLVFTLSAMVYSTRTKK